MRSKTAILMLLITGMFSQYAMADGTLEMKNERGNNYLSQDDRGVYVFVNNNKESFNTIIHRHSGGLSSDSFLHIYNDTKQIDVLCNKLFLESTDYSDIVIQPGYEVYAGNSGYGGIINLGLKDKLIKEIDIKAVERRTQEAVIAARSNKGTINMYAENINMEFLPSEKYPGTKMMLASGAYSVGSQININATQNIKIKGDIGNAYTPEWDKATLLGSADSIININNEFKTANVIIEGNIYSANLDKISRYARGNNTNIYMNNENSYLTGSVVDVYSKISDKGKGEGTYLNLENKALWNITDHSWISNVYVADDAAIDMTYNTIEHPKNGFRMLSIYNNLSGENGHIYVDIDASKNLENSDQIYIGEHYGTHYIHLNNVGNNDDGAAGTVLVSVKDEQGVFKAPDTEGNLYWNKYELARKDESIEAGYNTDWYLKEQIKTDPEVKPTASVDTILAVNSLNYHTWRTENDKLMQRMGELRNNGDAEQGAWLRVHGSKIGRDGSFGFENKYTSYQLGYDVAAARSDDLVRYQGVALGYTDGSSSYANGSGDNDSKSISVYNTDLYDSGHYLDLVLKLSRMDNDFKVYDTNGRKITGDFDNTGIALSAEYGRKNNLENGWYVEPQAQLTLGYMDGADYTSSNGIKVDQSSIKSVVGRLGFNIGREIGDKGVIYAKVNLLHEFGGGYDINMYDAYDRLDYDDDFDDTWFEYGIGAAFMTSKNSHVYFDVERSSGSDFYKDWQWNAGMRWTF